MARDCRKGEHRAVVLVGAAEIPQLSSNVAEGSAVAVASLTGEPLAPVGVLLTVVVSEFAVVPYKLWRKRLRPSDRPRRGEHPPARIEARRRRER
jgi:hypothetical protein